MSIEPKKVQGAALAVLAAPVLARRGWKMAEKMKRRYELADAIAMDAGARPIDWANEVFRTRGVR